MVRNLKSGEGQASFPLIEPMKTHSLRVLLTGRGFPYGVREGEIAVSLGDSNVSPITEANLNHTLFN